MDFDAQKERILNTLKSESPDRSRKGGVDIQILPLLNAINAHRDYYTTSSCAGRTVLIHRPTDKKRDAEWLIADHDPVTFEQVKEAIKPVETEIWLKAETPILHLACRTIEAADKFLQLCKGTGFKHAGIISAGNRIIIEVMGTKRLETIITRKDEQLINDDYLKELVELANLAMQKNREQLERLRQEVLNLDFTSSRNP